MTESFSLGIVIIGRNEGQRLYRCLESVVCRGGARVIYVDSGSTDGSIALAYSMGVDVVALDRAIPYTAARARNEGWLRLKELVVDLVYVQFVDADCEIVQGWLEKAVTFLDQHEDVAVVCGRRRERFPEQSIYNRLCDMEWDTPIGDTKDCGGDAMQRVVSLVAVGGYRDNLVAGEEPELCLRLRSIGWKIWRLDEEMTLHDAAIMRFSQWWVRTRRTGYAFAECAFIHGVSVERHRVKESCSAWFWGGGIPVMVVIALFFYGMAGWAILIIYPLQVGRLALLGKYKQHDNWLQGFFLVLGKFPEMLGQLQFLWSRWVGAKGRLIEYK